MVANFAFSTQWLDLREPYDAAARDTSLISLIEQAVRPPEPLRIIDLGAGTGANLRYLAPRLPTAQEWLLVDSDGSLLQAGEQRLESWAVARGCALERRTGEVRLTGSDMHLRVRSRIGDLNRERESLDLELSGQALISAAALLDLVSAEWLQWLLSRAVHARAMVLFVLNYTGQFHFI